MKKKKKKKQTHTHTRKNTHTQKNNKKPRNVKNKGWWSVVIFSGNQVLVTPPQVARNICNNG